MSSTLDAGAAVPPADDLLHTLDHPATEHGAQRHLDGWAGKLVVTPLLFWMFGEKTVRRLVPGAFKPLDA